MANIKFSDDQWERAKEYFEAGLSLSDITLRTTIDKASVSRRAKRDGWIKNNDEKQQLILDAVRVAEVKTTLNQQALSVHDELVNEKLRMMGLLRTFNEKAVKKATQMLDKIDNAQEFKFLADGVDKVSITAGINERHAKPTQINNTTQTANFSGMNDVDLMREAKAIRERIAHVIE
jgi:predicted DNA-binding protein YlxM (UPF0122 family)